MFRILVVDDDKNTRFFIKEALTLEGYEVFTAENGEEALAVYDKEYIDLVIVDIMMPKMDGYAFTRALRETNKELLVLMISARQLPEDRKQGFIAGIDDYMSKPIDPEELVLRLRALLHRARLAESRRITVGEVTVDYDSFTVTGHGQTVELPQKEFLLLYKLLSHPGKIFTKIQLMDEIWGLDCETGWETVTVHIGRLRKRFEGWDEFAIENVRGLGYKAVKRV
ncbi:MAG: response regulator transcription factor [Clostridia bacterium]|nr:response regulator transcription factor [Clostridia bacterium]MBR2324832.1 response regulator transcription factor [Clostridia bacterium]